MKDKKKIAIIICAVIIIILLVVGAVVRTTYKEQQDYDKIDPNDSNVINEIKNEINSTADTDMYQVEQEFDGRPILQIKPDIQYKTVLAGILKGAIPEEQEIDSLIENAPTETGIWISENSRDKFLEILKDNGITNCKINENGYLNSKEIEKQVDSKTLYIIDISGTCYTRDELSGEVVEYPFEKMDPYQSLELYTEGENVILEVTTNKNNYLSNQEILEDILLNMKQM